MAIFLPLWSYIGYHRSCVIDIPYEAVIRETIPKIPHPKVRHIKFLIPNFRGKYLKHLEEIFDEQKM